MGKISAERLWSFSMICWANPKKSFREIWDQKMKYNDRDFQWSKNQLLYKNVELVNMFSELI